MKLWTVLLQYVDKSKQIIYIIYMLNLRQKDIPLFIRTHIFYCMNPNDNSDGRTKQHQATIFIPKTNKITPKGVKKSYLFFRFHLTTYMLNLRQKEIPIFIRKNWVKTREEINQTIEVISNYSHLFGLLPVERRNKRLPPKP